ncbi:MAG: PAS domain S-box protein [Chloroflexi bacterium]|nr:PAS domain S-box protein [Chloroflexota bacterium]
MTEEPIHILYVDDYPLDRELVRDALAQGPGQFQMTEAVTRAEFEARLADGRYQLVLTDFNILGFDGLQVLDAVHARDPHLPVVIVTGTGSEEVAAEAMKRGAADYVIKVPKHIRRLPLTIQAVLDRRLLEQERQQAEKALRKSETALLEAQRIARIGSWEYDIATDTPAWSEEMFRIFGWDPSLGEPSWLEHRSRIHPEDWDHVDAVVRTAIGEGIPYNTEFRTIHPNGDVLWCQTIGEVVRDDGGEIMQLYGTVQDITARKQNEEALRESEEKYRTLFDSVPVGLYRTTPAGRVLDANPVMLQMVGYPEQTPFAEINVADSYVHPEDRQRFQALLARDGVVHDFETQLYCQDGTIMWVEMSARAATDADGRVLYYEGSLKDITKRRQMEAQIRRHAREL